MASLQIEAGIGPIKVQAGVQRELSDLEILVLAWAAKKALEFLAKKDEEQQLQPKQQLQPRQHATVAGCMINSLTQNLNLEEEHSYHGHFLFNAKPAQTIVKGGSGSFVHRASQDRCPPVIVGSKAAVVYGTNDNECPQLGYILAFFKSEHDRNDIKVYVEAGELSKIKRQSWFEIEKKLDASGSKSIYEDKETGAEACAEIKNKGCNNVAVLGACFNRSCPA